jgi:hypothetical protein
MDVPRMANFLLNLYGEVAPVRAEQHAEYFRRKGNGVGVETWRDIVSAVQALQAQRRALH